MNKRETGEVIIKPKFLKPGLLLHPNIPKPLHSLAPRVIKGQKWWDKERWEAYAANRFCCWACGIYKFFIEPRKVLHAHEYYLFDYKNGSITYERAVALCPDCHAYIHSGRQQALLDKGQITQEEFDRVRRHGDAILRKAAIVKPPQVEEGDSDFTRIGWSDWHMIIDGKKHYSPFKNIQEWSDYYADK